MRVIIIILIAIVVFLQCRLWFSEDGVAGVTSLKQEIGNLKKANDDLSKANGSLLQEIESLKNGGAAIENRAREDLGMVKKGEIYYQVAK